MVAIDISPNKKGGLTKEIIREGIGDETPPARSTVTVHYTAALMDGTIFDSSRDRKEPFEFELDKGVIKAWIIGVATMKKGEIAILTCDSRYAFGKHGSLPEIPEAATLKFEIEVIDWKAEDLSPDKDGSIERYLITQGKGLSRPSDRALVNVHLTGMYNGNVFECRDVQFFLGLGEDSGVIEGVELVLEKFQAGEKSRLKIKSKYAYKNVGKPEFNIPPDAMVEYIVELKSFEKPYPVWPYKESEIIKQSCIYKEKGNIYFKKNKYKLAIKMYKWMEFCLLHLHDYDKNLVAEKDNLLLSAHLNLALCYLKINRNIEAKDSCDEALKLSPQNEKALFRRGQAYLGMAYPEIAIKNFQEVLKMEPKNIAAAKQIEVCNNLIKKQLAKEKKLFANMFDKFAQEDKQKEEEKLRELPDIMCGALGEWGQEERPGGRDATAFEKENPNILMLNANGTDEFQNM